jgi:long-chain fatty acid transport protein
MRTRITSALFAALVLAVAGAESAKGAGFSLQDFDAKALGMSNAFAATANNPSANYFNPAGISFLDGLQGSAGVTMINPFTSFTAAPGQGADETTTQSPQFLPSLFGSAEVPGAEWLHLGLGTFVPFGLAIDWGKLWSGRYILQKAQIASTEYNLNLAVKYQFAADQWISLAAGGSIVSADALLVSSIDQRSLGADDARAKIKMGNNSNVNMRWNVAALLALKLGGIPVRFGLGYRDGVHGVELEGRAEFTNVATNPVTGLPILPPATSAKTQLALPSEVRGGIAVDPIPDVLTLEVDYKFQHWSVVKNVGIQFYDGQGVSQIRNVGFFFHDASFVGVGGEYKMNMGSEIKDFIAFRGGLYWDESPVKLYALSPALPDNDRMGFSLGFGFHPIKPVTIDLAYLGVYIKPVQKANTVGSDFVLGGSPTGNGKYETWANLWALTIGLQF